MRVVKGAAASSAAVAVAALTNSLPPTPLSAPCFLVLTVNTGLAIAYAVGWIFLLRRNRFVGSYLFFRTTNRSYLSAP
jgi:hypothetical protein